MSHKLHNPKSYAPAVYIPCWLIQVPINLLSHGAKMTYGRLSQWASSNGTVYRSVPQLSQELGCSERSIEEYLRELKTVALIGTYHPQAGGVNHFEFYDHEWMYEPIKDQLVYKQDKFTPPHHSVAPSTPECGTPPHPSVDINIKEIKVNKNTHKILSATDVAQTRNDNTFDEFWKIYPIKKNKIRAKKIWDKRKFSTIVTLICCDVLTRIKQESQWQDKQYIPHPSTYLGNKLWEDELTEASPPKKTSGKSSSFDSYLADMKKQTGNTYEHGAISQ